MTGGAAELPSPGIPASLHPCIPSSWLSCFQEGKIQCAALRHMNTVVICSSTYYLSIHPPMSPQPTYLSTCPSAHPPIYLSPIHPAPLLSFGLSSPPPLISPSSFQSTPTPVHYSSLFQPSIYPSFHPFNRLRKLLPGSVSVVSLTFDRQAYAGCRQHGMWTPDGPAPTTSQRGL